MIRINLLPHKQARAAAGGNASGIASFAIFTLLALSSFIAVYLYYSDYEMRLERARAKIREEENAIKRLKEAIALIENYKREKAELEKQLKIIQNLENARRGPVRFLDEISLRIPQKMWLTNVQQTRGSIVLSGFAEGNEWIANFLRELESSPFITNVELLSSTRTTSPIRTDSGQGESVILFRISCNMTQAT